MPSLLAQVGFNGRGLCGFSFDAQDSWERKREKQLGKQYDSSVLRQGCMYVAFSWFSPDYTADSWAEKKRPPWFSKCHAEIYSNPFSKKTTPNYIYLTNTMLLSSWQVGWNLIALSTIWELSYTTLICTSCCLNHTDHISQLWPAVMQRWYRYHY